MRNVHRILSTAFSSPARSSAPGLAVTAHAGADSRPYGTSGRLVSAPWEGLYLELDD